ncbi:MAG: SUF system Fe-S cluster assembly protein [Sedimenticola sp.]|nr:MAG: SUF system Fe-S cluster assembly protein [Sedimenticola sp.]
MQLKDDETMFGLFKSKSGVENKSLDKSALNARIIMAIKTVYDPEIPIDIYDLGLIYRIDIDDQGDVDIDMTLTAPACPVAGILPGQVQSAVKAVDGVENVSVSLVWDPPWGPDRMNDEAKLTLGIL